MTTQEELNQVQSHLNALYRFFAAAPALLADERSSISYLRYTDHPTFYTQDVVLAGKVLGTSGWTRSVGNSGFNWTKEVAGVKVTILDAEHINLEGTPVPAKAFPLALEESSPSSVEAASSPQTKEDDIPF